MARTQSHHVDRARVKPEKAPKGELSTSLARIGDPYTPRTKIEKAAWRSLVKQGLAGYLGVAEQMGATPEEVDQGIEALGFKDLYAMGLGEGVR
jgi:hypothetical protein